MAKPKRYSGEELHARLIFTVGIILAVVFAVSVLEIGLIKHILCTPVVHSLLTLFSILLINNGSLFIWLIYNLIRFIIYIFFYFYKNK